MVCVGLGQRGVLLSITVGAVPYTCKTHAPNHMLCIGACIVGLFGICMDNRVIVCGDVASTVWRCDGCALNHYGRL